MVLGVSNFLHIVHITGYSIGHVSRLLLKGQRNILYT